MQKKSKYDAVVIGGGFFGCQLSLYLKEYLKDILILEKESDLLQCASYNNQARVHNGYHYPRSILTAWRSRISFPQFVHEYRECIDSDFAKYYAVGKIFSKVNANQFKLFCDRIGSPIETASQSIQKLFNSNLIESVFLTKEYAFNAVKLKERMISELEKEHIEVQCKTEVIKLQKSQDSENIEVDFQTESGGDLLAAALRSHAVARVRDRLVATYVFNCTYSGLNTILSNSNLPTIPLKHELTEMALVEVPEPIKNLGITVMCGPFFSIMPFPARGLHTLSHVRYTPHCYWQDTETMTQETGKIFSQLIRNSNYPHMIRDAVRYIPILKECTYVESLWEVKTVLPQSEVDDSRPILFKRNQALSNLISVLGGKIDNVYDIPNELKFLKK